MITMTDTRLQLEKLDQQILKLLVERVQLCVEARIRDEGLDSREVETEIISMWIEESVDLGLDEVIVEKIANMTVRLCREEDE
ncbi:chorismate mutase [Patescibacteria group bacterium]|nr:chorismate mutase [Patescibacteria group bacterium]